MTMEGAELTFVPSNAHGEVDHACFASLVVFIHGLHGHYDDFKPAVEALRKSKEVGETAGIVALRPTVLASKHFLRFVGAPTEKGILYCADLVVDVIRRFLETHSAAEHLKTISVVGHSLGGLIARAVCKSLYDSNIIGDKGETAALLRARAFISIASPHLGIRRPVSGSIFRNTFNRLFHSIAPIVAGQTATELLLQDKDQVVKQMATDDYIKSLACFDRLVCYGNVYNDLQVPLCTSTLRDRNPYRKSNAKAKRVITPFKSAPCIVALEDEDSDSSSDHPFAATDPHAKTLQFALKQLNSLQWEKVDVMLSVDAHNQILGKSPLSRGRGVLSHLVARL